MGWYWVYPLCLVTYIWPEVFFKKCVSHCFHFRSILIITSLTNIVTRLVRTQWTRNDFHKSLWVAVVDAFTTCCCFFRFPVILSIENHCSVQQQRKIAQYLKGIFQDKLDLSSIDTGETKQLPSPQSLKGKILVKVSTSK